MHVAATTMEKLTDYVFHTPEDPLGHAVRTAWPRGAK